MRNMQRAVSLAPKPGRAAKGCWRRRLVVFFSAALLLRSQSCAFVTSASWLPTSPRRAHSDSCIERRATGIAEVSEARPGESEIFTELFTSDSRPVVLYDGVCNMCNKAVDVAIEKDPTGERLRFAALQSEVGKSLLIHCGRAANDISSMLVVLADGQCLVGSEAPLYVGEQLEGSTILQSASSLASKLIPKDIRDTAYNTLAANRYRVLGRRDDMRLSDDKAADRFIPDNLRAAQT